MARRREEGRVLGPYQDRRGWRVVLVETNGRRTSHYYETTEEADGAVRRERRRLREEQAELLTIDEALGRYELALRRKGNKVTSITTTTIRLEGFFGEGRDRSLRSVTPAWCRKRYGELAAAKAVDTHRNTLAEARTFARWCVRERLLPKDPTVEIAGEGRRRRGKAQLRIDEARAWLRKALELAATEPGAVAATVTLLMGLRASEVVSRTARDVDDGGRLLWIPESKTDAGRRTVEIPEILRPHFQRLTDGKEPTELLFGQHWRDWPREWVQRVCRAARVPEVTAHGMRGLHATLAEASGVTAHVVAASLGHESPTTTHKHDTAPEAVPKARQDLVQRVIASGLGGGASTGGGGGS